MTIHSHSTTDKCSRIAYVQPYMFHSMGRRASKGGTTHYICLIKSISGTYDHRLKRIGHPVRSAIHKLQIGRLVVGWVTTSEYLLLYVLEFLLLHLFPAKINRQTRCIKKCSLNSQLGIWSFLKFEMLQFLSQIPFFLSILTKAIFNGHRAPLNSLVKWPKISFCFLIALTCTMQRGKPLIRILL